MNIKEVNEYLRLNKYIFEFQGKTYITSKFIKDLKKEEVIEISSSSSLQVVPNTSISIITSVSNPIESTKDRFKRFIVEAEVPYRIRMDNGKSYTANAYHISAEKVLNKALKDGYDWRGIVMATKLYYKANGFKQKLSNYFILGTWESEYDEFVKKLSDGTIAEHVQQQIKPSTGERKML
jgi:formyltetrahydrofolate synthetase